MKTVITSSGDKLTSQFDLRFGRAAWFCVYDHESEEIRFIKNLNSDANSGAGVKTAGMMSEIGADRVISGDFGPKAKSLLNKLQIQMVVPDKTDKTVGDIIEKIKKPK